MRSENGSEDQLKFIDSSGPWPFVTKIVALHPSGSHKVLVSRHYRKGLGRAATRVEHWLLASLWQPRRLNWWIGSVFALGSTLFVLASLVYLAPGLAHSLSLDAEGIATIYFAGSIPFTIAAYLQLNQAANAPNWENGLQHRKTDWKWFGWRPKNIGWTSSALQFAGTILFNINTFDAMRPDMRWLRQDLEVWAPDLIGSVLFLAAGYLAYIETCHRHFAWVPESLSWWITSINLIGCIGFMVSAIYSFVSPAATGFGDASVAVSFTLIGAIGFLAGSLLMLPESAT